MKLTKGQLRKIIREETKKLVKEDIGGKPEPAVLPIRGKHPEGYKLMCGVPEISRFDSSDDLIEYLEDFMVAVQEALRLAQRYKSQYND